MAAALTLLFVLALSMIAVRTGAIALKLTGMPEDVARFQARSAFTGAGFTTSESEAIVNHPVRRRIVSTLMVIGSIGLVSVMTTMIVSLVGAEQTTSMASQLFWLVVALLLLWCIALSAKADRFLSVIISRLLERSHGFGARAPLQLLQLPNTYGVIRILIHQRSELRGRPLSDIALKNSIVLGVEHEDGTYLDRPQQDLILRTGDEVFIYGVESETDPLYQFEKPDTR